MRFALLLFMTCALVACNRPEATAPSTAPVAAKEAETAAKPFDANCKFCANPDFVRTCEIASGVRTTLYWNADRSLPHVGIFVVDDAGKDSSFAEQPPAGSIKTGPWLKPGLTFKLKDPAGNVLETIVISGKDC